METFAFIHAAVSYEDPNPGPELRSLEELNLTASAVAGLAGAAVATSVLVGGEQAMAATPIQGPGSAGAHVEAVQKALGIEVDGQYGSKTAAAVTDFQIRQGLKQIDGVVGKETASALGLDEKYRQVGYVVTRTGIGLNIRSGPGLDYRIVSGAPDGEYLYENYSNVIFRDGYAWTRTSGDNWIATNYTREFDGYTPASFPDNGGQERLVSLSGDSGVGVVITNSGIGLNVRSGPGLDYSRIGGAEEGSEVSTFGDVVYADGYRWDRAEGGGWVATNYLY